MEHRDYSGQTELTVPGHSPRTRSAACHCRGIAPGIASGTFKFPYKVILVISSFGHDWGVSFLTCGLDV